jgi:sulfotransferase family protein
MKIAFCTTCRGRTPHLRQTLSRNIQDNPGPDSVFVVLDYNSDDGLAEFIGCTFGQEMASGKLVYYRNADAYCFKMAHAKNMAHRAGMLEGADILVNLDADNFAGAGFGDYIKAIFERTRKDPQEAFLWSRMMHGTMARGINGRIAVTRNAFLITGGYDEKYETHSPDDKDFNLRLRRLGFCAHEIDGRYLQALNHNDKMRFREYPHLKGAEPESISQIARVANDGRAGCGTVYRNFDLEPITIEPLPTRIFGIGMHKTATRSLNSALRTLGFKSGHWENAHWAKAVWNEMRNLGKSQTLEHFYAVSDTPIPQLFRELDNGYPNSKFVLTIRDEADWLASVRMHFDSRYNPFAGGWANDPFTNRIHRYIYGREDFDEATFLAAYRKHNAEVLEYFSDRRGDLLVMDMSKGAGWQELAPFLRTPAPNLDYPTAGRSREIPPKKETPEWGAGSEERRPCS